MSAVSSLCQPLISNTECAETCYVCLEEIGTLSKDAIFKHHDLHPVCIDCIKGTIATLNGSALLCGICKTPIPEAMEHKESLIDQAKRVQKYRREAVQKGASPFLQGLNNIDYADVGPIRAEDEDEDVYSLPHTVSVDLSEVDLREPNEIVAENNRRCERKALVAFAVGVVAFCAIAGTLFIQKLTV